MPVSAGSGNRSSKRGTFSGLFSTKSAYLTLNKFWVPDKDEIISGACSFVSGLTITTAQSANQMKTVEQSGSKQDIVWALIWFIIALFIC